MATLIDSLDRRARKPPGWQDAEVIGVIDEAPDAVTLRLSLEVGAEFLPGQYYNVRLDVPGRDRPVQRAYSVGSSPLPDPAVIEVGVRVVPGGIISPRLVRDLPVGSRIEVRGPAGRFTWDGSPEPVLLIGAGSGLVPLMSMVRYAVFTGRTTPMWLVCSATTYGHAFYREELDRLSAENSWLRVVHCVTRDPEDHHAAYHRRIDQTVLAEILDGASPAKAYLCGPPAMVEAIAASLGSLGLAPEAIRSEKYD